MNGHSGDISLADIISFKGEYLGISLPAGYRFDIGRRLVNPDIVIYENLPEEGEEVVSGQDTIVLVSGKILQSDLSLFIRRITPKSLPAAVVLEIEKPEPTSCISLEGTGNIPVIFTTLDISLFYKRLKESIEVLKRPRINMHGVLMDIYGLGVIIRGKSGIGKSECALELITRGHRLVCDDMIIVTRRNDNVLIGYGSDVIKYHMEIRGLGIINVKDLFGISTIRDNKKIELVIELIDWENDRQYDRLGIDDKTVNILGISIPHIVLPVRTNRNIATIVEVAARNQLLKVKGFHSARAFQKNIVEIISRMGNIERIKEGKE
ncbi:MAG: HPr(Ser) kinase/phosphatase [Deltaproteobacteria bacterium]|nr:HPr(Ser) kinase/phosphatase [Deltaproteobacteria bacterium]